MMNEDFISLAGKKENQYVMVSFKMRDMFFFVSNWLKKNVSKGPWLLLKHNNTKCTIFIFIIPLSLSGNKGRGGC